MSDVAVRVPFAGTVIWVSAVVGQEVHEGQVLLLVESMKMEHEVVAPVWGTVVRVGVSDGDRITALDGVPTQAPATADQTNSCASSPIGPMKSLREISDRRSVSASSLPCSV